MVEEQIRTLGSRFEEDYGESVGLDNKMLPFLVRHCAWLITHCQVKSDGKTPSERVSGRPHQGQVAEFAEVVHFRDPNFGRSPQVSINVEVPREATQGQEDVD